jgi:hypothetical protein
MSLAAMKRAGLAANLAGSCYVAFQAPTDSIRVWYPTIWSYLGEHFLVFFLSVSCVFFAVQYLSAKGHRSRGRGSSISYSKLIGFSIPLVLLDVGASAYLWFVAPRSGSLPTLSFSQHDFVGYLESRESIFACVLLVILTGQCLVARLRARPERTDTIAS